MSRFALSSPATNVGHSGGAKVQARRLGCFACTAVTLSGFLALCVVCEYRVCTAVVVVSLSLFFFFSFERFWVYTFYAFFFWWGTSNISIMTLCTLIGDDRSYYFIRFFKNLNTLLIAVVMVMGGT